MKRILPFVLFESKDVRLPSGLTKRQEKFLNLRTRGTWSVNPTTGLVDVQGDFDCSAKRLESFPGISFGHVSGNFSCGSNRLTSLAGAPQTVGGFFNCSENQLQSLKGAPRTVGVNFLSDKFQLEEGEWNMAGWLKVLNTGTEEAKKLILTLPWLQPDWWNSELQRDPGKTVHLLATIWNLIPKNMQSAIKIPKGYEDQMDLFTGFDELGLF
jgi:hypothetical protein